MALVYATSVADSVSYEGNSPTPYTESTGESPGDDGTQSVVGISRFLDGTDTNNNSNDFSPRYITPGLANIAATTNCAAAVTIDKSVTPAVAKPGQTITYTLRFTNSTNGVLAAHGVSLSDNLPASVSATSVVSSGVAIIQSSGAPNFVWDVGTLPAKAGGFITITAVVDSSLSADTSIDNTADISSDDAGSASNSAAVNVVVPRVEFESATYLVGENDGTALITVTLDAPNPYAAVTVNYQSSDMLASHLSDYVSVSGSITIPAGSTAVTFTVPITDDNVVELDEALNLALSSPVGALLGTQDDAQLIIINDDSAVLSINDVSHEEGDSGTTLYTFTVSLSAPSAEIVTIGVDTGNDTATVADGDYVAVTNQTVTFNPGGALTRTVTVSVTGDVKVENNESFFVVLSDPQYDGATDLTRVTILDAQGIGTITNDDSATLSIDDVTHDEGNAGSVLFTFTVSLSAPTGEAVTVDVNTANDTATVADGDYTAVTGQTLTFAAGGALTQTVTVSVTGDLTVEHDESFLANLSSVTFDGVGGSGPVSIDDGQGIGTISNDDSATLTIDDVSHSEGNSGDTLFTQTVTLSAAVAENVTVVVNTANGSATVSDGDYTAVANQTVTFAAGGVLTQTVITHVAGDSKVEDDENYSSILSDARFDGVDDATRITIVDTTGENTILNDDSASVNVGDLSQNEGDAGTTTFNVEVSLSAPTARDITVVMNSADNTATIADNDYSAITAQTVTFSSGGALTQTVSTLVTGDIQIENHETFSVTLSNAQYNGAVDATRATIDDGQGVVTIQNDDSAVLTIDDVSHDEGDSGVTFYTFTVSLSGDVAQDVTVVANTANDSATVANNDYGAVSSQTLTFTAGGALAQTLTVRVTGDPFAENDETFFANLSDARFDGAPDATRVTILDGQGEGTILNDDVAELSIELNPELDEGVSGVTIFSFDVILNPPAAENVTVVVNTADNTATVADSD